MDNENQSLYEEDVQTRPVKTPEQLRAERQRYMKMQRSIRVGAIALAIVLSLISICVSCSTRSAVKELAETIAAKKAAQAALEAAMEAQEQEPEISAMPVSHDNGTVTMSFVGDCTLSSYEGAPYDGSLESYYDSYGASYFFRNVKSIFEGDDLTVVNLEGTFTTSTNRVMKQWTFKADPSYVDILTEGSVECANVANNHSSDYGDESYVDTLATLDNAGIYRFGNDYVEVVEINGVKVGFTGIYECEEGIACLDRAIDHVETLKNRGAEIIVCEYHWGDENAETPSDIHVTLAHGAIDAGADVVIGHHPHVLQGIEEYKGKLICYSLGNFCFGGNSKCNDKDTMIFQQTFTVEDGVCQDNAPYQIIPCSISTEENANTYCPTPATGSEAERILTKIYTRSGNLDGGITRESE